MKETWYDKESDVLNINLSDKDYDKSIELPNGMVLDLAEDGSIVSIEVLNASKVFSGDARKVIEMAEGV
tara:strand:+ start:324 stop:530 length:207 start_codon:yes stop_codon:yes gene_type:complete